MSIDRVVGPPLVPGTLSVGAHPTPDLEADVLVLCARELQPPRERYPRVKSLWHAPLDDDPSKPVHPFDASRAREAGTAVARLLRLGKNVVVTCHLGLNRSALVATLALVELGVRPAVAVGLVRRARGPGALNNHRFIELIKAAGAPRLAPRANGLPSVPVQNTLGIELSTTAPPIPISVDFRRRS